MSEDTRPSLREYPRIDAADLQQMYVDAIKPDREVSYGDYDIGNEIHQIDELVLDLYECRALLDALEVDAVQALNKANDLIRELDGRVHRFHDAIQWAVDGAGVGGVSDTWRKELRKRAGLFVEEEELT